MTDIYVVLNQILNSYQKIYKPNKVVIEARKSTHLEFTDQVTLFDVLVNLGKYIFYNPESQISLY